jgi:hypothetical protein
MGGRREENIIVGTTEVEINLSNRAGGTRCRPSKAAPSALTAY